MGRIATSTSLAIVLAVLSFAGEKYNRGVGIYPGNPDQDFAPALVTDSASYRNLALLKPAYHSSSYDYNLTAQLVIDGIKEMASPRWLVTTLSGKTSDVKSFQTGLRQFNYSGPYSVQTPKYYFKNRATPKLHSELGMPNVVNIESLRQMMPEAALWPRALAWGLHDYNLYSNVRISELVSMMDISWGGADKPEDWLTVAQFINYDGYRAIFEAQSKNRMGILLWMSHPCWPSFVWQTYDYYFDPTAGYFGSKKGSEPLHIQWNAATDNVEVVNYNAGNVRDLTAKVEILNIDGSLQWEKSARVDSAEDSAVAPIALEYPAGLSPVHFTRLKLTSGGAIVSENFYWRSAEEGNFRALRSLPKIKLETSTRAGRKGQHWILKTVLKNSSSQPALMIRLKAVRAKSGDRILPAIFSDNYVSLMPGEQRSIQTQLENADTRGEAPRIAVEGFNVAK